MKGTVGFYIGVVIGTKRCHRFLSTLLSISIINLIIYFYHYFLIIFIINFYHHFLLLLLLFLFTCRCGCCAMRGWIQSVGNGHDGGTNSCPSVHAECKTYATNRPHTTMVRDGSWYPVAISLTCTRAHTHTHTHTQTLTE